MKNCENYIMKMKLFYFILIFTNLYLHTTKIHSTYYQAKDTFVIGRILTGQIKNYK